MTIFQKRFLAFVIVCITASTIYAEYDPLSESPLEYGAGSPNSEVPLESPATTAANLSAVEEKIFQEPGRGISSAPLSYIHADPVPLRLQPVTAAGKKTACGCALGQE
jgi:hypothetical protein